VKDSDSSPDKTENADDMSLADLLGGGEGKSEDESPRRVEHREDEPDSGMVNLAKMVAASSIEVAKTPSMAPPPPPSADQSGVRPVPAADPSGVVATQGAPLAAPMQPMQKKSNAAVYALIAVVVIAAVIIGIVLMKQGDGDDKALDKMMAELQAKAEADRKAAEEKEALLLAKLEEMSKASSGGGAVSAADQAKMDAVKAELDAAKAEKEAAAKKAEEAKSGSSAGTTTKTSEKPKKETTTASTETKKTTTKTDTAASSGTAAKATEKPTETAKTGSGASELDSLLGSGAKEKPAEEKPAAKAADELPKQPSKEQVTAAMAPIKAKAQASCAKYSTGTVQVSMVVSSAGKVTSAKATGVFANNPAGTCVAMMARSAKFPKFKDPTFTFTYPIVLQ
jgi:hypothetical protein